MEVTVDETDRLESVLKKFRRQITKAGLFQDMKRKRFYESPAVQRRRKSKAARRRKRTSEEQRTDGTYHRYREVVQRCQGLRVHHTRERRQGLLRASHSDSGRRIQIVGRRPARGVRDRPGSEGSGGAERREAVTTHGT